MKKLHPQTLTGLIALLTFTLAANAGALGVASGSTISNTGYADFTTDDGVSATATSTPVSATVAQVFAVSVTPDGTTATPGQVVYTAGNTTGAQTTALTYTLSNPGNGTDTFNITTSAVSANVTAANVKYYTDTDGNGVYTPGTDTLITAAVSLAADATKVFFAVYTTPANTTGATNFDVTPAATSVGDATKTDANNLGRIVQKNLYDLSFTATQAKTITTPGTAVYAQTITNTGNVVLTAAQIVLAASAADTTSGGSALAAGSFTQSYTVTIGGTTFASAATPQAALNTALGAGTLAVNAVATLNTTVTSNTGRAAGDKDVLTLSAGITGVTNSVSAFNLGATPITVTDTSTVVKGAGTVTKTQALCGVSGITTPASCPASGGAVATGITVKPGDYVVYYLTATNVGSGNLFNTRVRDVLPAGVSIYSLAAISSQAGNVLYSTTGGATAADWKADPTTLTVPNGATVYAGFDTDANGIVNASDVLPAGKNILFRIKVKVNDGVTAPTAPVTDAQTVS